MFVPLHVKSDYSLGFGTASIEELVQRAVALGYPSLALTDLENLYAQVRFHRRCREKGVHPVTGVELRRGFDGRHNLGSRKGRVVLLALDDSGYKSLCRIVSRRRSAVVQHPLTSMEPPHGDPLSLATRYAQGLFALSDDPAVLEELLESGRYGRERLAMLLVRPDQKERDRGRIEGAMRLGLPLIADLDAVFLKEADHALHLLQLAIRQGRQMRDTARSAEAETRERWLRSAAEAALLFADQPAALEGAERVSRLCTFDIFALRGASPLCPLVDSEPPAAQLAALCQEALLDMVPEKKRGPYRSRLGRELALFEELGFTGFMLVVADIISHCRRLGIPVAVRGSAVSSLALHLLGGSGVDPIEQALYFERFLHAGKSAWPDVDIDLPWHRRDEVIDWVFKRYGHDKVAMVAAHHTFRYRSALRSGLKAWGAPESQIDRMSALLPPEELAPEEVDFLGVAAAGEEEEESRRLLPGEAALFPRFAEILPLLNRLVGRPHHIAAHPGGIVVDRNPLEELLPLERAPKGVIVTQYDLLALAELGVAKIDLLGNRCLSELEEALLSTGESLHAIPMEDPATLSLIDRAETIGCFQLESPAMRSLLKRLPIRAQSDIAAALALIRPGAASGEVKNSFVRRARHEEPVQIPFPALKDRLSQSHGLFLYEEDLMALLSRIGGITLEEADEFRRAIVKSGGDPEILAPLEGSFLKKVARHAGKSPPEEARRAWEAAVRFAAYSFNKAHAASYGLLAYYSAFAKVHHPLQFACALLNHHQGLYPLRVEVAELVRLGVPLLPPQVNASLYHTSCEERGGRSAVRVGLDKVKGLSVRRALELLEERARHGNYLSLKDLLQRVSLTTKESAALILSGTCDGLSPLSGEDYPFVHEAALEQLRHKGGLAFLEGMKVVREEGSAAEEDRLKLYQALVRVKNELLFLEMHLKAHPMALLRHEAERYDCLTVEKVSHAAAGKKVRLAVIMAAMRRVPTKQGVIQFLTVEDETGLLEGVLMPPVFLELGDRVKTPGPFLVEGRVRRQLEAVHLEVSYLCPFHQRTGAFADQ